MHSLKSVLTASAAIGVACLTLASNFGAVAQVRRDPWVTDTVSRTTAQIDAALFGPDGYFLIAGGVALHGAAHFMIEQDGHDRPIAAASVVPVAEPGGGMALQVGGETYQLAMPAKLACPLSRFAMRDGLIAYTILKYTNDDSPHALIRAGVVRHRLAREFDGTGFEPLLRAADFAATVKLPDGAGEAIASSINASNGIGAFVLNAADETDHRVGSYINSDVQVTYNVYLMANTHRVEIAGVPLRYYWLLDNGGSPGVFSVEAAAQNWPADAALTDWAAPGAKPTQYDVVNFYQVAGLIRQLSKASPTTFASFADQTCRS